MTAKVSSVAAPKIAGPNNENDRIQMLGLYEEDLDRFGKILRTMNIDNIPEFASSIRQLGHSSTGNKSSSPQSKPLSISCKLIVPPLCGSYHIVFPIEFEDGMKWMLKVSANGDHFDSVAAAAMTSEAQTMRMLKKETSIPVPTVYAFDTSSENPLSAPFILMEKLDGRPLNYLWFNQEAPKPCLEHFRIKILQNLAEIMVQLNKFTVSTSGSLVFGSDGTPVRLGAAKVMDAVAEFNKVHRQDSVKKGEYAADSAGNRGAKSDALNPPACVWNDNDIIYERGPFSDPKAYLMSNLDRSDPAIRADAYERGTEKCLRLFIDWAFPDAQTHNPQFVLSHPDLDVQNILVADDGTITGLIDWDGVAAVPREVGCAQYPLWLMRDWVPSRYNYDTEAGKVSSDAGYQESSPAELATYRALYAQSMEVEIANLTGGSKTATTFGTLPKDEARLTRRSLIMRHLDLSAGDPWAALSAINHIIDQIEELTAPEWDDTDSDTDSFSSCSSVGDPDTTTNSDIDEEMWQATILEDTDQGSSMSVDVSVHNTEQKVGETECVEHSSTASVSLEKAVEGNHGCPTSSRSYQKDSEQPNTQEVPGTPSIVFRWLQDLQKGCYRASEFLMSIVDSFHVLDDVIDEVAEDSAEVEAQITKAILDKNPLQISNSSTSEPKHKLEHSGSVVTGLHEFSLSQDITAQGELNKVRLVEHIPGFSGAPKVDATVESKGCKPIAAIRPQEIPARKAELLQAARIEKRAERKAHYLADKAAIKKELKIWENIAFAVWVEGVTLEQLRKNQRKIASWVVDTFQPEPENEDGLTATSLRGPPDEATAAGNHMVHSSPVDTFATRALEEPENTADKLKKLESAFGGRTLAAKAKIPCSFRAFWESGISYVKYMLYSGDAFEDKRCNSPESSASTESDREEGGSDVGDAQSSTTSLSDGDGEEHENDKLEFNDEPKTTIPNAMSEDAEAQAKIPTAPSQFEGDTDDEDDKEDPAGENEGEGSSTHSGLPEFIDHGGFDRYTICNLLGTGELDELRMLRLKDGFLKLLELY